MENFRKKEQDGAIRRYNIIGSRRFSNYWWTSVIFFGSCGFLLTGYSSFVGYNLFPFIHAENITFFPQGLVMCFYGFIGLLFSFYLALTIYWSVGGGFNEFNKKEGIVRIFRWGFPGKTRQIDLRYYIQDVEAIRVELKEGFNPRRTIFIRIKGKKDIPLTRIGHPMPLQEIEKQAADLAKFLQVSLEGL
jgi:hypothetical protein